MSYSVCDFVRNILAYHNLYLCTLTCQLSAEKCNLQISLIVLCFFISLWKVSRIRGTSPKRNFTHTHSSCTLTEPLTKTSQLDGVRKIIMSSQKTRYFILLPLWVNFNFNQNSFCCIPCLLLFVQNISIYVRFRVSV
jgi:hypothetical protein